MNDVVTAARPQVLVTGFGPFPGAPTNPTLEMLRRLELDGVEGVDLALARLPVTFAGVCPALREAARHRPDAVLMLGLARERAIISLETLARNVVGLAHPDTDGAAPMRATLVAGAPATRAASWPAAAVLAALHDAGHAAAVSQDAGDYVCNAALFHALGDELAPMIGFLHVPNARDDGHGPTAETLTDAARCVIAVMAAATTRTATRPAPAAAPPSPGTTR